MITLTPRAAQLIASLRENRGDILVPISKIEGIESDGGLPDFEFMEPTKGSSQQALYDLWDEKKHGRLFLVSKETRKAYEVLQFDGDTKKAIIQSPTGMKLNPTLGERETSKYFPVWC